jgi:hypothetical protein
MIEIVQGKSMLDWAGDKLAAKLSHPAHAIGLAVDGTPKAAFVFTCQTPHDIEISAVVDGCALPRRFLKMLLEYAWVDCGLSRISATTESNGVVTALMRFGFKIEGIKTDAYGEGRDGVLLGLIKGRSILE